MSSNGNGPNHFSDPDWFAIRAKFFEKTVDPSLRSTVRPQDLWTAHEVHIEVLDSMHHVVLEMFADEGPSTLLYFECPNDNFFQWDFACYECDGMWSVISDVPDVSHATRAHPAPKAVRAGDSINQRLFLHIQIFGHPGSYTIRFDNDAATEETFSNYNSAIYRVIRYLSVTGQDLFFGSAE